MKSAIIKGTIYLTIAGIVGRIFGFLYRIFLSNLIGADGMGIFQLITPVLMFCTAISCGGIQIAVSRFVAESKNAKERFYVLISSLVLSLALSLTTFLIVYNFSFPISHFIIKNSACNQLLKYASITIPLAALHSCICGYCLGLKKTFIPVFTTILEQAVKLAALLIIGTVWLQSGSKITPIIAVYSLVISEAIGVAVCVICVFANKFFSISFGQLKFYTKRLLSVSYILTANKILLSFLQCLEAILIPFMLVKYGLSNEDALSQYGILMGMALPLITFPSAISNSLGSMILPEIAEANTCDNVECVQRTSSSTIWFSMVTGIFCTGAFTYFGDFIGQYIFSQEQAAYYIKTLAWVCPFMYLSITLGSILHGLGRTTAAFIHNVIGIAIRLLFLWFLVPHFGMQIYLIGLLVSNIAIVGLHFYYVYVNTCINFDAKSNIIKPTAWLVISLTVGKLVEFILSFASYTGKMFDIFSVCISAIFICFAYLYFVIKQIRAMSR